MATSVRSCSISFNFSAEKNFRALSVPETVLILRLIGLFATTEVIGRINNYYVKYNVSASVCVATLTVQSSFGTRPLVSLMTYSHRRLDKIVEFRRVQRCEWNRRQSAAVLDSLNSETVKN